MASRRREWVSVKLLWICCTTNSQKNWSNGVWAYTFKAMMRWSSSFHSSVRSVLRLSRCGICTYSSGERKLVLLLCTPHGYRQLALAEKKTKHRMNPFFLANAKIWRESGYMTLGRINLLKIFPAYESENATSDNNNNTVTCPLCPT